jgi:hypothetical protein
LSILRSLNCARKQKRTAKQRSMVGGNSASTPNVLVRAISAPPAAPHYSCARLRRRRRLPQSDRGGSTCRASRFRR